MATEAQKNPRMWECKNCHRMTPAEDNMAYHLVGGILYGWCAACFSTRAKTEPGATDLAA